MFLVKLLEVKNYQKLVLIKQYQVLLVHLYFHYSINYFLNFNYLDLELILIIFILFLISLISQLGDLFISFIKRKAKIKDTGNYYLVMEDS